MAKRKWVVAIACLALSGVLISCATTPPRPPVTEEEREAFDRAVLLVQEDPTLGRSEFEKFVRTWPESAIADDAAMRLGMLSFEQRDRDAALRWFYFVVRNHADGKFADEARVRAATLEYGRGEYDAAREVLARVRFSQLNCAQRRAAFRVLVSTASDDVAALRWLARLRAEEIDEERVDLVDDKIDSILRTMEGNDFERAAEQIGRRVPSARILLAGAEQALDAGDLERARKRVDRASRTPLAPKYAARLTTVGERLRLREEGPAEIEELPSLAQVLQEAENLPPSTLFVSGILGVVLPLSGPYAAFGRESLQGVLLASRTFEEWDVSEDFEVEPEEPAPPAPASIDFLDLPTVDAGVPGLTGIARPEDERGAARVRLLIRDSGGTSEGAARAVRELAQNEEVTAIIGPLVKEACEAAAIEAEAAGIPMLALSSREEIAAERPHVFRLRTRAEEEVSLLVEYAMRELGAQTFAVLHPDDAYGKGLRNLYWDEVEKHGGEIVGSEPYDPKAVDFAESIRRLVGYAILSDDEEDMLKERKEMFRLARRLPDEEALPLREAARALLGPTGEALPPVIDFDALFIPESHEKVVLIAPQLAFHEAVGMRLLGSSGWYHPDLVSIGRGHVRDALVASLFFEGSQASVVQDFSRRFIATFHEKPDSFSACAYDAANLVLVQFANGLVTREGVRDGVLGTRSYPGVSGVLSIAGDGNARRRPFLLEVGRRRFVEVE